MLIDSHTHLNFKAYHDDLAQVITRCHEAKMKLINVGAALDTSTKGVNLADANQDFYAAVGLHPVHVNDEQFDSDEYQKLIDSSDKVVAVGETGFDYFHEFNEQLRAKQEEVFKKHISLAQKNNLAMIIHGRGGQAYQDILRVLKAEKVSRVVSHCFGGTVEEAQQFVTAGYYLGFTGIVTFDKTGKLEAIVKQTPLDKILIETDAPYLTPVPYRGKRNEPAYVYHVAEKIGQWLDKSTEEIIELTCRNAIKLFNLK